MTGFARSPQDYAFFLGHSTEREANLAELCALRGERFGTLLEFGCGDGGFLHDLLQCLGERPGRLLLVEPSEELRAQAGEAHPEARTAATWDELEPRGVDVLLAKHSVEEVADLPSLLRSFHEALAPGGRALLVVGARDKFLNRCRAHALALAGRADPRHTAEGVREALQAQAIAFQEQDVPSVVEFRDTPENRLHFLRYAVADPTLEVPVEEAARFFDACSEKGVIREVTEDRLFLIPRDEPGPPA